MKLNVTAQEESCIHHLFLTVSFCSFYVQNRELLEEARAAKCYRDELDFVREKVTELVHVELIWL